MKVSELKERKIELGYTNEMIAEKSGVPLGTVQKVFGGTTTAPRFATLKKLEEVLFPGLERKAERRDYEEYIKSRSWDNPSPETFVNEESALDEYNYMVPGGEYIRYYEKVFSWKKPGEYTVDDWIALPDGVRMELIGGTLYDMAPPATVHQFIAFELYGNISNAVRNKGESHKDCLVLGAPVGVQICKDDKNMLEPDVLIVCDKEKYKGRKVIYGAPDYVAEVLSPSNKKHDKVRKFDIYRKSGVREYWIIDPEKEEVCVYQFGKGISPETYSFYDQIPLGISGGEIVIDFKMIAERMHGYFDY